ncbi:hypothetical protein EYF80_051372 [Liparis tanakae]|uniref:Uncharacterized protein n=1 Tax=Liparis tanakae TaxID=230148 RepID=A0A4Z2FC60_9TELE|nr:hypothetical protein EYF80_051372 [Liparis tanakae]
MFSPRLAYFISSTLSLSCAARTRAGTAASVMALFLSSRVLRVLLVLTAPHRSWTPASVSPVISTLPGKRREGVRRSADEERLGLLVFLVAMTSLQLLQQTAGMRHGVPEVFHAPVAHGVQTHSQGRQSGGAPPQHRAQLLEDRLRQPAPLQAAERERPSTFLNSECPEHRAADRASAEAVVKSQKYILELLESAERTLQRSAQPHEAPVPDLIEPHFQHAQLGGARGHEGRQGPAARLVCESGAEGVERLVSEGALRELQLLGGASAEGRGQRTAGASVSACAPVRRPVRYRFKHSTPPSRETTSIRKQRRWRSLRHPASASRESLLNQRSKSAMRSAFGAPSAASSGRRPSGCESPDRKTSRNSARPSCFANVSSTPPGDGAGSHRKAAAKKNSCIEREWKEKTRRPPPSSTRRNAAASLRNGPKPKESISSSAQLESGPTRQRDAASPRAESSARPRAAFSRSARVRRTRTPTYSCESVSGSSAPASIRGS